MVTDINAGLPDSVLGVYAFGSGQAIVTVMGVAGFNLWLTDGTAAGTHLAVAPPSTTSLVGFFPLNSGAFLMVANGADDGRELWTTDGTADGTSQLADIRPGPDGSDPGQPVSLAPSLDPFT